MTRRAPSVAPELPGYDVVSLLRSSCVSEVFLYQQRLPRRRVAVQVWPAEGLSPTARARFLHEAHLAARLSTHPYIVTIFNADVTGDGRPYLVMEYCSGASLADRYQRHTFRVDDALRTGIRLAGAIATGHSAGILHGAIRPANVLSNDFGWPALIDFGIPPSLAREPVLPTGLRAGTAEALGVPWSPPEAFAPGSARDVRGDVYSLAATIHTLLAGRAPFEARGRSTRPDLIGRIRQGAVTPIGRDDLPGSLVAVLATAMATQRDDRFATIVDLARALRGVESELGFAPTGIDLPTIAGLPLGSADAPPGDDHGLAPAGSSDVAVGLAPVPNAPLSAAAALLGRGLRGAGQWVRPAPRRTGGQ